MILGIQLFILLFKYLASYARAGLLNSVLRVHITYKTRSNNEYIYDFEG